LLGGACSLAAYAIVRLRYHGSRWIGDTRITISFVTWAIYLALVFVRVGAGWRGRKTAILAIIALLCSAVTWVAHAHLGSRLV